MRPWWVADFGKVNPKKSLKSIKSKLPVGEGELGAQGTEDKQLSETELSKRRNEGGRRMESTSRKENRSDGEVKELKE
ncbi:hypothetical protein BDV19DRAFT_354914 [Aspergillus venezuelensis]